MKEKDLKRKATKQLRNMLLEADADESKLIRKVLRDREIHNSEPSKKRRK